ncbi:MAG: hypothetical protein H6679_03900 [Epsilonproteobacteria bacterium]|nr:hypothetical protein [Campylobacterota bacterium]
MTLKKLLSLSLAFSLGASQVFAVAVNKNLWQDASSILSKLGGVRDQIGEMREEFKVMIPVLGTLEEVFIERDKQRDETYKCLRDKFKELEGLIGNCLENKGKVDEQRKLTNKSIQTEIDKLTQESNIKIKTLQEEIDKINERIAELKASLATLTEMNGEKVKQIIDDLSGIRSEYETMMVQRELFKKSLTDLTSRLQAYNHDETTDTTELKKDLCTQEGDES